jgi:hypothetical protein
MTHILIFVAFHKGRGFRCHGDMNTSRQQWSRLLWPAVFANKVQTASELGESMTALFKTVSLKFWLIKLVFALWFHGLSCVANGWLCMGTFSTRLASGRYSVSQTFHLLLCSPLACFPLVRCCDPCRHMHAISPWGRRRPTSRGNCHLKQSSVLVRWCLPERMCSLLQTC